MERIRTIVKEVNNTVNQGKKIFFCVDDVCKVIGISKKEWNKLWNAQKEYTKRVDGEFYDFFQQNNFVEKIYGANGSYESLYCTINIFKDVLDYEDYNKIAYFFY